MSTQLKESTPVPVKGSGSSVSGGFGVSGYLPSGIMLATILKELRHAQSMELEIQQDQAETEQNYYKQLGGIDNVAHADGSFTSDITKGLMSMTMQSTIDSGADEADGLRAQGISSAVNAGVSGASSVATAGYGIKNHFEGNGLDEQIKQTKEFGEQLNGPRDGNIVISAKDKPTDDQLEQLIDNHGLKPDGTYDRNAIEAIKTDPQLLQQAKERNNAKLEELQNKQKELSTGTQNAIGSNQTLGMIIKSATDAAGTILQAKAKEEVATDNASAAVQKQVQDMNYASANTFKDNAKTAAQQALQTSDTLAQVAQSQVQFRG